MVGIGRRSGSKGRVLAVAAAVLFLAAFGSCTEFFATSLAPWAARNPEDLIPKVTAGNVDELVSMAERDPDMSLEVLRGIQDSVNGTSESGKAALRGAALDAAANAIGGASAIVEQVGSVSTIDNQDEAKQIILDTINGMGNLDAASSLLTGILPPPPADPFHPDEDFLTFTDAASVEDLALTAVIIIAGEVKRTGATDFDNYMDKDYPTNNISEDLAVALAIAVTLEHRQDEISDTLQTMLEGLNLGPSMVVP